MDYVIILAGGSGTRLWPLSRRGMPKQLLPLIDGQSLLQLAYQRATMLVPASRVLICAGRAHLDVVARQLPQLPADNLLGEPIGRDSLAAVAWATAVVTRRDPAAVVTVLSADHVITPASDLLAALRLGLAAVAADPAALVVFGVEPRCPHTGYGYIRLGPALPDLPQVYRVERFAEKPDRATAEAYLRQGGWLWNAGLFCFRAATFARQLADLSPDTARAMAAIVADPGRIDAVYPGLPAISIDYAMMEPTAAGQGAAHVDVVGLTASWADIGSFPALAAQMESVDGNAVEGAVIALNASANVVINRAGDGHLIAIAGLRDTVVVQSGNVTLVCAADQVDQIKRLAELARQRGGDYA